MVEPQTIEQRLVRYGFIHVMSGIGEHRMGRVADGPYVAYEDVAALLDRINMLACYASEENTEAQAEVLLMIGKLARQEPLKSICTANKWCALDAGHEGLCNSNRYGHE